MLENLTNEQRDALACRVRRILAELWCDQNGVDAEITIVRKDGNGRRSEREHTTTSSATR